jgi:DNA polymerase II large subunit
MLEKGFKEAYDVASEAKAVGFDPRAYVEIKAAPDLAGKVEGLIGVKGLADLITKNQKGISRRELIFQIIKEICTNEAFSGYETIKRIELAVKVALAMETEGVLVAPTEGIQGIGHYRNPDGSDYISVAYAGPIRSAGGTAVALSVAFADYARKFFNIGDYKATQNEVERYVEELEIYHERVVNLQYKPSADDLRTIVSNCPVCVEGVTTEEMEVSVHANIYRKGFDMKEQMITNKVRGGVPLVLSSIAQKAKSVSREVKKAGLDWNWLDSIITVDKTKKASEGKDDKSVFLDELVAGRPILAYPKHFGGFRLRYGRSRMTGIAAKGFSPATMIIVNDFISIGTQLKIELPGKGCVAGPVDSIEGPFVRLRSGETLRINDADTALKLKGEVERIICLGDILITYGDFRKTNTPLQQSSYVEELWEAQLRNISKDSGEIDHAAISFEDAYRLSVKYGIPLHPKFLFEFQGVSCGDVKTLAKAIIDGSDVKQKKLFEIKEMPIHEETGNRVLRRTLELMTVPYRISAENIVISDGYAQSLLVSLGFASGMEGEVEIDEKVLERYKEESENALEMVNSVSPVKLMKRSTFLGARIGRPEKAKERMMKPTPNVLFPVGFQGVKDRNLSNAYAADSRNFGRQKMRAEIARYKCNSCGLYLDSPYCYNCDKHATIERVCKRCGAKQENEICANCGAETVAYEEREIDLSRLVSNAISKLGNPKLPRSVKGVKGLVNRCKVSEPLEKGILRSMYNVFIFKDGTSRFDATDMPMTHFYPKEVGVSVERLREMGYEKDYNGNLLTSEEQLLELRHQDVILNRRGAEYLLNVTKFMDDMLQHLYGLEPFYKAKEIDDLIGQLVLTLAPHTSCAVLNRIVGFTDANVGFAHPFTIAARRRNADGDEDTTMLLLDALVNFSKDFLPTTIGGTMDAPLLLTTRVMPEEIDDEVHAMEIVDSYPLEFYEKTFANSPPSDAKVEIVENRLRTEKIFENLRFTHGSSSNSIKNSPKRSIYTVLKTMDEKIDAEFKLMDSLESIDRRDAARRLIMSHFIPDLIGNLHSFSKQKFRCSSCNAKYRRVPLSGKCTKDGGKLLLTISKGSIEKYLETSIQLAERYDLDVYTRQRLDLIRDEIDNLFGSLELNFEESKGQFNLVNFM